MRRAAFGSVWTAVREVRSGLERPRRLVVAGDDALVARLSAGAAPGAVAGGDDLAGAAALVLVAHGRLSEEQRALLRRAERARVGAVCVLVGAGASEDVPYVLATDVVRVSEGVEPPVEEIARRVAERAGDEGYALAARVPALRRAVCERLVRATARQNAVLAAAIVVPGADLPALYANQARMVLRLAAAHGERIDRERARELLPLLGAGFGLRAVARSLVGAVPIAGWAIQSGVAYSGTLALGRAAVAHFERERTR